MKTTTKIKSSLKRMSAEDIRTLRRRLGLNQAQFWSRVGVTQSGGSRYESGRTPPRPVQMLLSPAYGKNEKAKKLFSKLREPERQES